MNRIHHFLENETHNKKLRASTIMQCKKIREITNKCYFCIKEFMKIQWNLKIQKKYRLLLIDFKSYSFFKFSEDFYFK